MPAANAEAMSVHLTAIGHKVAAGSHAALVLDGAGYHIAAALTIPENVPLVRLPPTLPNSIRSKTSGNICAATNSPSPSSTTTTTSLIKPATHGTSLNKIQCASPQSPPEHGRLSMIRAVGITPVPSNTRSHHTSAPPRRRSSQALAVELAGYRSGECLRVDRECRRQCDPEPA